MSEITDPPAYTILLIEAHDRNVPWAQPKDLSFDEAVDLLSNPASGGAVHTRATRPGFFYKGGLGDDQSGINVAMADGSVRFLEIPLPRELAVALLTVAGGEGDLQKQLENYWEPQLDYGRIFSFSVFVILSLWPAFGIRKHWRQKSESRP